MMSSLKSFASKFRCSFLQKQISVGPLKLCCLLLFFGAFTAAAGWRSAWLTLDEGYGPLYEDEGISYAMWGSPFKIEGYTHTQGVRAGKQSVYIDDGDGGSGHIEWTPIKRHITESETQPWEIKWQRIKVSALEEWLTLEVGRTGHPTEYVRYNDKDGDGILDTMYVRGKHYRVEFIEDSPQWSKQGG